MKNFKKLNLNENLLRSIEDAKFSEPSEIQEKTIPLILEGRDVLGSSATGSGKTLAFGAGIIQKIDRGKGIQALILTPTRELADQVTKHLRMFSKYYNLKIAEIYGGVSINPQIEAISRADIIVGTPGRILDHLNRRTLNLSKIRFLVLDEADKMLDMGFIDDVYKIISVCPKNRQTLLFSATISNDIEKLSKKSMKDPIYVSVESYVDASKLTQIYYDIDQKKKFSLLAHLLKEEESGLVMVFCNTRRNTNLLAGNLQRYGLHSLAIHGGLPQNKRTSVMKSFHSNETYILICTDIAARGLDIPNVSHVYNYDIPKTSTEYIHRIGRTARAGKEGKAVSLVSSRDYDNFRKVLNDKSLIITREEAPEVEELFVSFSRERERSNFRRPAEGGRESNRPMGRSSYNRRSKEGGSYRGERKDRRPRPTGSRDRRERGSSYSGGRGESGERSSEGRGERRSGHSGGGRKRSSFSKNRTFKGNRNRNSFGKARRY